MVHHPLNIIDPVIDFKNNCKGHVEGKDKYTWLCYDCKKFVCTRCYSKDHKKCWADLVENMHEEMLKTNESNLEALRGMKEEFNEEVEFMEKKYDYLKSNNPFDVNINLINKIYDNIIELIEKKRQESLKKMEGLRDNYMKNIEQNINKVRVMLDKTEEIEAKLVTEINAMNKQPPFDFCKGLLESNHSSDLADECNDIATFQRQEFTRIKQSFIDTNTIVFNDSNAVIEQCKNLREYLTDKVNGFYTNYHKYQAKYAFTVVMNQKEFIVYLIDNNRIAKVSYVNDFVIPSYARWIDISGDKLILTGGEKDYIESLNTTHMFKFRRDESTEDGFSAKVFQKADMIYRRRAHSLIYFNDYM